MRTWVAAAVMAILCQVNEGQQAKTEVDSQPVILFGNSYSSVRLAVAEHQIEIANPSGFIGQGFASLPSLAPAGDRVVWGLTLPSSSDAACIGLEAGCSLPGQNQWRSVVGVYTISTQSWKFYGDFCSNGVGSTAFSPDGMRVAFFGEKKQGDSRCGSDPIGLHILDLASGQSILVPQRRKLKGNAKISWSPDGKSLVGQVGGWGPPENIVVIDVESGDQRIIANGTNPSWSPNGEWIAYTDEAQQRCMMIHPDGTGAKELHFATRVPMEGMVWSPDSDRLLINDSYGILESKNEAVEYDLASGKIVKKFRHSMYAFGWAFVKH